ncbi:MAG: 50S ribosomal protein L11 methyltransferase [Xanthomonadales bacterium]|nr:50S ribosomal protein L11 methyltransferase [Xanthomonadales bacterium]
MSADPGVEISLWTDRDGGAEAEAILEDLGALAVTLADAGDQPVLEPAPGEHPLWPDLRVTGYFPPGTDPGPLVAGIRASNFPGRVDHRKIEAQDWERAWMAEAKPMCFGERLWVVPSSCEAPPEAAAVVVLDPGLAFGTGTHPSTAMCLEFLDSLDLTGRRVLDLGCGSGILAVAAGVLGAEEVLAVDIDPQAEQATRLNIEANDQQGRVRVAPVAELAPGGFDVIVANILAGTLVELAPLVGSLAAPGGALALAGILDRQIGLVEDAYRHDFEQLASRRSGEWALVTARRRGD